MSRRGFTLIELLVVIAIIAVLAVVVILALNPAELLKQSRDANRLSDMTTLNQALGLFTEDVANGSLGSSNVVYVSIPDPLATSTAGDQCQGLGLINLPATYAYHCSASSTYKNIDGTGWIPADLKLISSGSPIGVLPVDPTNSSSSRLYYTYTTDGKRYEVTAAMESQKYRLGGSNDSVSMDGGTKESLAEKGTSFNLEPLDYGDSSLVGYWSFEEGTGSIAYDYSGTNATGSWNGTQSGTSGYYSTGIIGNYAGAFDGTDDYISVPSSTVLNTGSGDFSFSLWLNNPGVDGEDDVISKGNNSVGANPFNPGTYGWDLRTRGAGINHLEFCINNGGTCPRITANFSSWNTWANVVIVVSRANATASMYINGAFAGSMTFAPTYTDTYNLSIGQTAAVYFPGLIDDVRLYNRALSAAEIQGIYNSQR